ncbi:MAG: HAD family phosphatase [Lentisphaerae bacterium]|nr:HAD family phosphatase [Lentisphaerota bacterium]
MKAILFDIGNVLVDFEFGQLYEVHAEHSGRPVIPFSDHDLERRNAVEMGQISDAQWVEYLNGAKGLNWSVDDLINVWRGLFSVNKTGYALFRRAVKSNVRVYTLSNIAQHHIDAIEANWPGFFSGADGLFFSYQMGVRKPHPNIYRHALAQMDCLPEECLFIDDLPENVNAARALGFQAIQFVPENYTLVMDAFSRFSAFQNER